jgi:TonB family protein
MPKKVLLIEYEPRYIERIRALLQPLGHALTETHDGEAGLQAFGSNRFDLVLLSGMLPRLPSAEVIREIRKKGGATAPPIVLMMSGYRGTNRKADAQKVGAFDILVRPFSDEDFMASIREAVGSTDVGAKTMRIDTAQVPGATPLTSSDIFSDVLSDLIGDAARPAAPRAPAPPSAPSERTPPPAAPKLTAAESVEKRLRDTLSGLNLDAKTARGPGGPAAPPPRPRLSSDTDVDKILSDTLSGISLPKSKPAATSATPLPVPPPPAAPAAPPRRREEPAAAVPATGPDHFGQYEILEKIASGGMAELSKAKRTGVEGFQKIVAIKKILPHLADDEAFITMFADEAKLAAQLNHPNIIHIYDLGKIKAGGYFIAMEYVDGRDLRGIELSAGELGVPLPVPLAVYIASKVASALDYAHRRRDADGRELNIVHRDVSPQNILISYEGDIKLCDFGIAKAASKASKTQSGALKGKMQYMSPEQAWGKPIDRRSDLFSLGVVLHELLTGERLFRGDTDINILEKVRNADVAPPSRTNSEVSQSLDAVVMKALAKEPDERYANASDMLRDLDSVLYSYTPAPGSADVAIYLHRLQAEEAAVSEAKAREAAAHAATLESEAEPARKRKSKGAPISRRSEPAPRTEVSVPATPAPTPPARPAPRGGEVFGSLDRSAEAERKSRTPLFAAIAVAAAALVGFAVWKLTQRQTPPPPVHVALTPSPAAAAVPTAVPAVVLTPTAPALDPKAVEAEVQRQLAAKRKEMEKAAAAAAAPKKTAEAAAAAAELEPTFAPTALPTPVPTARPEPTAVPTEPPFSLAGKEVEVQRGDLVGPGPGVVEPTLLVPPRVVYPPIARQQHVGGRVVVLVLVDETGQVTDSRLQQGLEGQSAVNNAVVAAVKAAKFRPGTKNGTPVKMWRPVIVQVTP